MKQNALVAQGMQTFLKRYKNLTEYGQFHNARLSIVHFIALGGWKYQEYTRCTCAEDGEFPSMLCQLVEDANQCQEERWEFCFSFKVPNFSLYNTQLQASSWKEATLSQRQYTERNTKWWKVVALSLSSYVMLLSCIQCLCKTV